MSTKGFTGKYGDAVPASGGGGSTSGIQEVTAWEFEPAQKVGTVVTNATNGFEGKVIGAVGGKGKVEVVVPASAGAPPLVFGSEVSLTLKADKAGTHSFVLLAVLTSVPVSINLASEDAVKMTFNFEADGEFTATGMFAMLGAYQTP